MTLYQVYLRQEAEPIFQTEVEEIAQQFVRSPESFIPRMRGSVAELLLKTSSDAWHWRRSGV